ncbi:MAG: G-D-S-L family lipolytic protein [Bacteroidetes bacterium]|nr:MAG: G-D-S-L family lipolytic protein [Bacteroidota bacterium]
MKKTCLLLMVLVSIAGTMRQQPKTIVFFGDSITEAGVQPGGYINLLQQRLEQQNRAGGYNLVGAGISGNKVYDLYLRMEADVLAAKPTMVVVYIGVNDVWHKSLLRTGTDADKFEAFYQAIIKKLQQQNIEVVLCTPAAIGEQKQGQNPMDKDLDAYSAIIRQLASKNKCKLVDLREMFVNYSLANNSTNMYAGMLTTDGVHLNPKGNALLAEQFLKILP